MLGHVTTILATLAGHIGNLNVLAFSADHTRYDRMLGRMFGISGYSTQDHQLDFSRPASAAYYFAPALNVLEELVGPG